MSKKKYYTYTVEDLKNYPNTVTFPISVSEQIKIQSSNINFHPDHIDVLDINFEIGQLVETYEKEIGIVLGKIDLEESARAYGNILCGIYRIQVGTTIKEMLGISLKKIKLT
jgi:hypothetical protein